MNRGRVQRCTSVLETKTFEFSYHFLITDTLLPDLRVYTESVFEVYGFPSNYSPLVQFTR
jgi:hypothetical protein